MQNNCKSVGIETIVMLYNKLMGCNCAIVYRKNGYPIIFKYTDKPISYCFYTNNIIVNNPLMVVGLYIYIYRFLQQQFLQFLCNYNFFPAYFITNYFLRV